ncbi:MAG: hypothetical protein IPJ40_20790 [Saprospirales bacterium]|nr:hypothetical protein [Saprospirales bacterium]
MKSSKRILIAPLNWGLGHATRSIPIIRELIKQGHEVWLASDGRALDLLKREFPDLPALELPEYDVRYPKKWLLQLPIVQMPKVTYGHHPGASADPALDFGTPIRCRDIRQSPGVFYPQSALRRNLPSASHTYTSGIDRTGGDLPAPPDPAPLPQLLDPRSGRPG